MKIQFDIKYRPQIESGKYKVETEDGIPARIICWDSPIDKERPIIAIVFDNQIEQYKADGRYNDDFGPSNYDLFIITPEPELTEFENGIKRGFLCAGLEDVPTGIIKDTAKELLELAKKELCKDCCVNLDWYDRGWLDKIYKENRVYKHEGPTIPAFWPHCHFGGECTNPFHDCIKCPRQSTIGINTTTGTSAAKVESHE